MPKPFVKTLDIPSILNDQYLFGLELGVMAAEKAITILKQVVDEKTNKRFLLELDLASANFNYKFLNNLYTRILFFLQPARKEFTIVFTCDSENLEDVFSGMAYDLLKRDHFDELLASSEDSKLQEIFNNTMIESNRYVIIRTIGESSRLIHTKTGRDDLNDVISFLEANDEVKSSDLSKCWPGDIVKSKASLEALCDIGYIFRLDASEVGGSPKSVYKTAKSFLEAK